MKIIDISKRMVKDVYNGNKEKAVLLEDGVIFTEENIINCFCGCVRPRTIEEATKQLKRFISDNKQYSYFYDYENKCFL